MKEKILEYTQEEISQLSDDRLDQAWKEYMGLPGKGSVWVRRSKECYAKNRRHKA
jgi:hypothetical protein